MENYTKGSGGYELNFSIRRYFGELEKILEDSVKRDWYKKSKGKNDIIRTSFLLAKELELRRFYFPIWMKRFSKKVPQRWENWREVYNDFELAQKSKIQLDQALVDAGITHPVSLVAKKAGKSQRLNLRQLAWLLSRPYFMEEEKSRQEIIRAQKKRGLPESEIKKAIEIGQRVKEKLTKWRARNKFPTF